MHVQVASKRIKSEWGADWCMLVPVYLNPCNEPEQMTMHFFISLYLLVPELAAPALPYVQKTVCKH